MVKNILEAEMMHKVGVAVGRVGLILMLGMFGVPLVAPSFSQSSSMENKEQSAALKEAEDIFRQIDKLYWSLD